MMPATIIIPTGKMLLLMENEPTTHKTTTRGQRKCFGMSTVRAKSVTPRRQTGKTRILASKNPAYIE